jgi:hypothetical protein
MQEELQIKGFQEMRNIDSEAQCEAEFQAFRNTVSVSPLVIINCKACW